MRTRAVTRIRISLLVCVFLAAAVTIAFVGTSRAEFSKLTSVDDNLISIGFWNEPPHICSICPCFGFSGTYAYAFVWGDGFQEGSVVQLESADNTIMACLTIFICDSCVYCVLDLRGAAPGLWDVRLTNPDGGNDLLEQGFKVIGCWIGPLNDGSTSGGSPPQQGTGPFTTPDSEPDHIPGPTKELPAPVEDIETVPTFPEKEPICPEFPEEPAKYPQPGTKVIQDLPFSPGSITYGDKVAFEITGRDFPANTVVVFEKGNTRFKVLNATIETGKLTIQLDTGLMKPGTWEIRLEFPDGRKILLKESLAISE